MPTKLTPLFGSSSTQNEPFCSLLEIDEAKILLDCGCFEDGSRDAPSSVDWSSLQQSHLDLLVE